MKVKSTQMSVLILKEETDEKIIGVVIPIQGKGNIFFTVDKMDLGEISSLFANGNIPNIKTNDETTNGNGE